MRLIVAVSRAPAEKVKPTSVGDDELAPPGVVDVPTGTVAAGVTEAAVAFTGTVGSGVDVGGVDVGGVVIAGLVTGCSGSVDETPVTAVVWPAVPLISADAVGGTEPAVPAVVAEGGRDVTLFVELVDAGAFDDEHPAGATVAAPRNAATSHRRPALSMLGS